MANWVCRSFDLVCAPYAKLRCAAYDEFINGRLLHNRAYHNVPEIRIAYLLEVPD
jgi:hypothetical protein